MKEYDRHFREKAIESRYLIAPAFITALVQFHLIGILFHMPNELPIKIMLAMFIVIICAMLIIVQHFALIKPVVEYNYIEIGFMVNSYIRIIVNYLLMYCLIYFIYATYNHYELIMTWQSGAYLMAGVISISIVLLMFKNRVNKRKAEMEYEKKRVEEYAQGEITSIREGRISFGYAFYRLKDANFTKRYDEQVMKLFLEEFGKLNEKEVSEDYSKFRNQRDLLHPIVPLRHVDYFPCFVPFKKDYIYNQVKK